MVDTSPSPTCCREVKKCKAYDSYQLLARTTTFREQAGPLLAVVHSHLGEASHPKTRTKVVALLHHAGRGFAANPSAGPQDLMVFVHSVLEPGLAAEEAARQLAQADATTALPVARGELLCWRFHIDCVRGCMGIKRSGDDAMHICLEQACAVGSLEEQRPQRQQSCTSNLRALHTMGSSRPARSAPCISLAADSCPTAWPAGKAAAAHDTAGFTTDPCDFSVNPLTLLPPDISISGLPCRQGSSCPSHSRFHN